MTAVLIVRGTPKRPREALSISYMDRLARLGGTADGGGQSPRGSGNPAEYEQRLSDIFRDIITTPQVRLVQ